MEWNRVSPQSDGTFVINEVNPRYGFIGKPHYGFKKTHKTEVKKCVVGQKAVYVDRREVDGFTGPSTRDAVLHYEADVQEKTCTLFENGQYQVWCFQRDDNAWVPAHIWKAYSSY